jgi:ferritin-like metal-binding protein YciE
VPDTDIRKQLVNYLTDVRSTEENAINQRKTGADAVQDERLAQLLRDHLAETEEHERPVRERLELDQQWLIAAPRLVGRSTLSPRVALG